MTLAARKARPALTMLEVLLVMSMLSVLCGLFVVGIQRSREAANLACCQAHLRDLALAMHHYESDTGKLPPYASGRPHEMYGSWYMHLLPYVGHQDLYEIMQEGQHSMHHGVKVFTAGDHLPAIKNAIFPELVCASDPTRHDVDGNNTTNYLANWYALSDGVRGTYRHAQRRDSLANGLSNVVMLAEAYSDCHGLSRLALYSSTYHNFGITQDGLPSDDHWYAPKDYLMFQDNPSPKHCDKWRTQTAHAMMPVALADGTVRNVSPAISPHTWRHLMRARDAGEHAHHHHSVD